MRLNHIMPRSDKKNCTCVCCEYNFTRPEKLRKHYASTKNQCSLPLTSSQPVQTPTPQVKDQGGNQEDGLMEKLGKLEIERE